ncbi:unnamed protein product [Closterium sp. Naga37s-1]|nr:unnamed protein product [Closterium sp. Naga37s-1]
MQRAPAEDRSVEMQEALLSDPARAKEYATHCVQSFLWEFNFSRTPWGNTYLSLMPDILHAIYLGWWLYLRAAIRGETTDAYLKDERMSALHRGARLAGVRVPSSGQYWASGANFTATEHAAVMMGQGAEINRRAIVGVLQWHESCIRGGSHIDDSLDEFAEATRRRGGMPREFSAAVYENAHIRTCKQPYRVSNRRQVEQAIADHNTTAAVLARLPGSLPPRNTNQTAIMKVHNGLALPPAPTDEGHIKPHYARAAVELHGQPAFSCVEYERDDGAAAFGKLCLLLTAQRSGADGESGPAEVAVLTSFLEVGHDDCTGCTMLSPVTIWRGLVVVPLHRLVRAVHCVPSFENPDLWFLNKWAFRCLEDIH